LYYQLPYWLASQRTEYFTFTADELKQLRQYDISSGIYFAITLAVFKQQHTLVDIAIDEVKQNIEHVMQRYYSNQMDHVHFPIAQKKNTY
jgi:hypothetical protein